MVLNLGPGQGDDSVRWINSEALRSDVGTGLSTITIRAPPLAAK
jgi:hypothetical protein